MDVLSKDLTLVEPNLGFTKDTPTTGDASFETVNSIIRGTMSFDRSSLKNFDPSYTGYTQIFVLRGPKFLQDYVIDKTLTGNDLAYSTKQEAIAKTHYINMKAIIELASTSYSGTPDLTLNSTEINTGFSDKNIPVPTYSSFDSNSFSIKCLEFRGEPLRKALEYYITGISDPASKYSHMHLSAYDPKLENYSMDILVVQTDQTLKKIQNYDLWQCVTPTQVPRDQLNWDAGNIDIVQGYDVQLKGFYVPMPSKLETKVQELLAQRLKLYKRFTEVKVDDLLTIK